MQSVESAEPRGLAPLLSPGVRLALVTGTFFIVALVRIGVPDHYLFDEQYYVPAAARLALGIDVINREHPMLGKELLALFLSAFGGAPAAWRIGPLLFGCLGLWTFSRAVGVHAACRRTETIFAVLLASSFLLFSLSRIAMLDAFMFGFCGAATLCFVNGRWNWAGLFAGLATACKWSAAPLLALFCLSVLPRSPLRAVGMGIIALLAYFASFIPGAFMADPLPVSDWAALHYAILTLHGDYIRLHAYASQWWQWIANTAPIWLLHGDNGALVMTGNPVSMPMIPLALIWAGYVRERRALAPAAAFAGLIAFWAMSGKDQQFIYHYLLPMTFGLAVAAIGISRLWPEHRPIALGICALPMAAFAWFFPVLTAAPGAGPNGYDILPGWEVRMRNGPATPEKQVDGERREGCLYFPQDCWPPSGADRDAARTKFLELRARQEAAKAER